MQYFISFLEGIITFISPCLLPMLPVYISYFAGGENDRGKTLKTLKNAAGFVLGFTIVFVSLGAFAGSLGSFLKEYRTSVNVVCGMIVILFGLNFMGILKIRAFNAVKKLNVTIDVNGFFQSVLFGIVFSVGWSPCVGTFLGSALLLASQKGSMIQGIVMLVLYSVGLGIPFMISAVLIHKLKGTFQFIKAHYHVINTCSGIFLIATGIFMMTGTLGKLLSLLSSS
ncbi:MAG: cytochrome c biogenesis protein CcdA [Lachnospiraceae bacterium]|nr:cytochrome c biogenesis protein CcdA [Lachnospiraceae bacterium]